MKEWQTRKAAWPEGAQTLYFGGGTPSLLAPEQIAALISALGQDATEITLEANPEDLNPPYLKAIREAGVTRLSLGVQSFEDNVLKKLGRMHTAEQARQAIQDAKNAGFERISVDQIVGIEGENWVPGIEWLAEQGIGHVSVYLLTVETGTPLDRLIQKGRYRAPGHDEQADAYEAIQKRLAQLGYRQYEISSYALPGQESQHNRVYWSQGQYLGLGPGAHSMRLHVDGSVSRRHTKAKLGEWSAGPENAGFEEEHLSQSDALREALAFGLRDLVTGIEPAILAARHRSELPAAWPALVADLSKRGWIREAGGQVYMTALGARFGDAVAREILAL